MKTKITPQAFAARIRLLLQIRNLTVPAAARACQMPQPTFEMYLYAKSLPGAEALANLAKGLVCTVDWLLFGEKLT